MKSINLLIILILFLGYLGVKSSFCLDINQVYDFSYRIIEGTGTELVLTEGLANKRVEFQIIKKDLSVKEGYKIYLIIEPFQEVQIKDNLLVWRIEEGYPAGGYFYISTSPKEITSIRDIYYSDKEGIPFKFSLIFGIKDLQNIEEGRVRLKFILEPQSVNLTGLIIKNLDVTIRSKEFKKGLPEIEIKTITGAKKIYLNPRKTENTNAEVLVKIKGYFKERFSIKQRLNRPLTSNQYSLDYNLINYQTKEVEKGRGEPKQNLTNQPYLPIYMAEPNGDFDSEFVLIYGLEDLSKAVAGRYISQISYFCEYQGQEFPIDTLDLEVEIEPIFELVIKPQYEKNIIEFRNLKPNDPPKRNEVILEIRTNIAKPYQVSQEVFSELINNEGNKIPPELFTFKTEPIDSQTKGILKVNTFTETKKGQTILFISDNRGSPDKFKVIYELKTKPEIKAGDYSTQITYSLTEI